MNESKLYLFFCHPIHKKYILFGVLQNFSNKFMCSLRGKMLKITALK